MKKYPYHSALKNIKTEIINNEIDCYSNKDGIVFARDICSEYSIVDISGMDFIYSEPAWRTGYKIFIERAGQRMQDDSYRNYLDHIKKLISRYNLPTYILMGYRMKKYLNPERCIDTNVHDMKAFIGIWNSDIEIVPSRNNLEFLESIFHRYNCVYDFSCGYGNTARIALRLGKKFMCSDINKQCIYYIAKNIMGMVD